MVYGNSRTLEELNQEYNIEFIRVYNDEDQVIKVFIEREDELELVGDELEGRSIVRMQPNRRPRNLLKKGDM